MCLLNLEKKLENVQIKGQYYILLIRYTGVRQNNVNTCEKIEIENNIWHERTSTRSSLIKNYQEGTAYDKRSW